MSFTKQDREGCAIVIVFITFISLIIAVGLSFMIK